MFTFMRRIAAVVLVAGGLVAFAGPLSANPKVCDEVAAEWSYCTPATTSTSVVEETTTTTEATTTTVMPLPTVITCAEFPEQDPVLCATTTTSTTTSTVAPVTSTTGLTAIVLSESPGDGAPPEVLAFTGGESWLVALVGAGMLAAGGTIGLVRRRRVA